MLKIFKNKIAGAFNWVYGLISLFAIGLMYTVFLYVFRIQFVPVIRDITNTTIADATQKQLVYDGINNYMFYFEIVPYILILVIAIYMIVSAIRKEGESRYI